MVTDRFGTSRTVEQIDAIWRYHAARLCDPYAAHAYMLDVYGLAVRGGSWRKVSP